MADLDDLKNNLADVIAQLDPEVHAVTIAHLNDAIEAMEAIEKGGATKFALHDRLIEGAVVQPAMRRKIR